MRILFYAHSSTLYGANRSLIELILGLKEINPKIDILLILPEHGLLEEVLKQNAIPFFVVKSNNWFFNYEISKKWKNRSNVLFQIWKHRNKYSKVIGNAYSLKSHISVAKKFSPNVIYVNSSLNPMGLIVARKLGIKTVWHHREVLNDTVCGFCLENEKKFLKSYFQSDLHIFSSQFLRNNYFEKFGEVNSRVIFNSIVIENSFEGKRDFSNKIHFGIVGRINFQKGQKEIINLFQEKEIEKLNIQLEIVGHANPDFLDWLNREQLTNVKYHDFVPQEKIYEKFDFLIANAQSEAFGRTIAEANLMGIPAIVRYSGAFPEIVIEGINGFIFKDLEELKTLLPRLSAFTEEEYFTLSESSFNYAKKTFNYREKAEDVEKAIKGLFY